MTFRTVPTIVEARNPYQMVHIFCPHLYLDKLPDLSEHEAAVLRSLRDGQDGEPDNQEAARIIAARRDAILELRIQHLTFLLEARQVVSKQSRVRWKAQHPEKTTKTTRWSRARWWSGKNMSTWGRSGQEGRPDVD